MAGARQRKMERMITAWMRQAPAMMYDIGVGPKSEWDTLHKVYPDMQLVGCEPEPTQYAELSKKFPGLLLPIAIDQQDGEATLYVPPDNKMISGFRPRGPNNLEYRVQTWTLDRLDAHVGCPDAILLWMDIEGAELRALLGGQELLSSGRVHWVNLEERAFNRITPECANPYEMRKILHACGFPYSRMYNKHPGHHDTFFSREPFSGARPTLIERG